MTAHPVEIAVGPLRGSVIRVRLLDAQSALEAMVTPARFRRRGEALGLRHGIARVRLAPYAYARLDADGD